MNTINKYIKHLSLFFIVVGLVISSGVLKEPIATEGPKAIAAKASKASSASEHDNLWDRLRADFNLNHATGQKLVQTHRAWYRNNPDYIEKVFNRAGPYLYYIAEEIEARDFPLELILVPVVESMYNPNAKSRVGALGLWQLMAATARAYGVIQNGMYDGRRDIHVSTQAALDHLRDLAQIYNNDWALVLAAYNAGAGTVNKAIKKNKAAGLSTDFWSLSSLPKETRHYVPKIYALADVMKNYHRYDFDLPPVADEPQIALVDIDVEDYLDLTIAANLAEIEPETLREMNPGFTQTIIANNAESLLMPIDHAQTFEAAIEDYKPQKKSTSKYTVQSGDTLGKIAKANGVSVAMIQQYNNLSSVTLQVGQVLKIPRSA